MDKSSRKRGSGVIIDGGGVENDFESPTKVLCLTKVIDVDKLRLDVDYLGMLEDLKKKGSQYGSLVDVVIPREYVNGENAAGVGKVFLVYDDTRSSVNAKAALHGRSFRGDNVVAVYYPEERYLDGDYGG